MSAKFNIPLDIPNVEILDTTIDERGNFILTVKSTIIGTECHKCGALCTKIHGYDEFITLRHLPILDKKVFIRLKPARYQCEKCEDGPTSTQKLPWYTQRSANTKAYERYLLKLLINSTLEDVSKKEDIGYKAVQGILDKYIDYFIDWRTISRLGRIGLDEISLKKGHKHFVTIVTSRVHDETILLGILPDRKKETVKQFLEAIPDCLKKTIEEVCCDMYDGFIEAAKKALPATINIVSDRFHVAKQYRNCLDTLRKTELKRLKQALSAKEYKKLKGAMWALRKKRGALSEEETTILELLFQYSPALQQTYDAQNQLTTIFDQAFDSEEAQYEINSWISEMQENKITCFESFIRTFTNYKTHILNYFNKRSNSGFVEGFNNKLKVIKRRCYVIFNLKHFFQRAKLDFEGYELYA